MFKALTPTLKTGLVALALCISVSGFAQQPDIFEVPANVAENPLWSAGSAEQVRSVAVIPKTTTTSAQAWGYNYFGQLGNGTYTGSNIPVPVSGLTGITAIAGNWGHSLALKNDGTVWSWGRNSEGQLGNGTYTQSNVPVPVSGLTGITAIAGGMYHSLALKNDGTVWSWGGNYEGQLGNGTYIPQSNVPVPVSGLTGITAIARGGSYSLALKNDGTVWAWGYNNVGQLGNGTYTRSNIPVPVSGLTGITAIAGGWDHSLALKNDGTVWAWGYNNMGQLGNGTYNWSNIPVPVSGLTGIGAIAGGQDHSLASINDGAVWAWGNNGDGRLGNGTYNQSNVPVPVSGLTGIRTIAAGFVHSLALKNDGTVWSWGGNSEGQLGNGTYTKSNVPVPVSGLIGIGAIAAGGFHSLAFCSPPGAPVITGITDMSACAIDGITVNYVAGSGAASHDLYKDGVLAVVGYAVSAAYIPGDAASHNYVVQAINGACTTDSNTMAGADENMPAAPTAVTATPGCTDNSIAWTNAPTATSHNVLRGTVCGTVDSTFTGVTTPFNDTTAVAGTTYNYWVVGVNACGTSENSACDTAARPAAPPEAPTTVTATAGCTGNSIAWTNAPTATSHNVLRGTVCGTVDSTFTGVTTPFNDTTAVAGTTYSYWVAGVNACGTSADSTCATAARLAIPVPTVMGAIVGCATPGVALSTEAFNTYQWYRDAVLISGATSQGYTATLSGTYTVTVTDSIGCFGTSPGKAVTVYTNPSPTISGPSPACGSAEISTEAFTSYQWYRNGSAIPWASLQSYSAVAPGNYSVRVTDTNECSGTSAPFVVGSYPSPSVTGASSGCGSVALSTGSFTTYQWNLDGFPISGETAQSFEALTSGTYTVTVTNVQGCEGTSGAKSITVLPSPEPTIAGPGSGCGSASLSTQSFSTYQWNLDGTPIGGATNQNYEATLSGNYTVTVTNADGCQSTSPPLVLTVSPIPSPTVSGPSSGCGSVALSTEAATSYQWRLNGSPIAGATGQGYAATQSGNYSVTVTNSGGCQGTSSLKAVEVLASPNPLIVGGNWNACPDTSVLLTADSVYPSYQWRLNGSPIGGATSQTYPVTVTGTYSLTVTAANGCTATSPTHTVFVDFCPTSEVSPTTGPFPARLVKDAASPSGFYLYFQRLDSLDGYNVYEGDLGYLYSHAATAGNLCGATVSDLGTGEMRAVITPSAGDHYYLVTGYGGGVEGPSGFSSQGQEIPETLSTCGP